MTLYRPWPQVAKGLRMNSLVCIVQVQVIWILGPGCRPCMTRVRMPDEMTNGKQLQQSACDTLWRGEGGIASGCTRTRRRKDKDIDQ